jgi:hypothetical protein
MNQLAWFFFLISHHGRTREQGRQPAKIQSSQNIADRRDRQSKSVRYLGPTQTLKTKTLDLSL